MPVLVVDDNATNRRILQETLTHWQMRPVLTANGPDALEALKQAAEAGEPFRMALVDVQMPEMDGYMLCERIRQDPALRDTILIILTSGGQPGDHIRRRELNVAAFLIKPVKQTDLWRAIMQSLGMPLPPELCERHPDERVGAERRLCILLAEDNLVNQKLAVRLLQKRGHQVTLADNGRIAVDLVRSQAFDVVLMDVQMPEMDGYEATVQIREDEKATGRHVRIIAMTAYAMKGDRDRCLDVGMDSYISKPIRARELFETVESTHNGALDVEAGQRLPGNEIFNRDLALARVGDDVQLFRELAELFVRESPQLLEGIRAAICGKDANLLKTAAHGLKGCVDNFAAQPAFAAAMRLETMGGQGDLCGAASAFARLEYEISRLTEALLQSATEQVESSL